MTYRRAPRGVAIVQMNATVDGWMDCDCDSHCWLIHELSHALCILVCTSSVDPVFGKKANFVETRRPDCSSSVRRMPTTTTTTTNATRTRRQSKIEQWMDWLIDCLLGRQRKKERTKKASNEGRKEQTHGEGKELSTEPTSLCVFV